MDLLLIAWRYLVARPITLVSTLSVTVGLIAIVVVDSVMNGFLGEQRSMIRALAPDVAIEVASLPPEQAAALLERMRREPDVIRAEPRVEVAAMHRAPDRPAVLGAPRIGESYFVNLVGVEPSEVATGLQSFLTVSKRPDDLAIAHPDDPFWFVPDDSWWSGRLPPKFSQRDDLTPVIFGRRLAYLFGYHAGTVLTIATLAGVPRAGERLQPRTRLFVVVGTFSSRDRAYDETHALVARDRLVDFASLAAPIEDLALTVRGSPAAVRDRLRVALAGEVAPGAIETWEDRKRLLLGAVEGERRVMNVAMFFVVIVATFSLFVTLHQMVRRKTRDIGVLSALGAPPLRSGLLFLLCGFIVTLGGSLLGLTGGLALAHWLNPLLDGVEALTGLRLFNPQLFHFDQMPVAVDLGRVVWYAFASVVCGTLFTLLPALRAARLDPVEALRHE